MMEPKIRFSSNDKNWEEKNIGDIFFFKNGLNKDKSAFGQGTPIINYTDVYHHRGLTKDLIKGKVNLEADEIRRYKVRQGDVFFTRTSETPEEVGFSSVMLDEVEDCSFSGFVLRARPTTNDLLYEYCKECFSTGSVRKYITSTCSYTTRALTNGAILSRIPIYIPQKVEQQAIASYFTSLDSQISASTSRLASLKQMKAASLQAMFPQEGETVPKIRFKGFEGEWKKVKFGTLLKECTDKSTSEDEDILLSSAINGVFLNSELFGHQRGRSNIGYRKIRRNMLILSAQNLHLGNANVNLRFEHGLVSPAYKIYDLYNVLPEFMYHWIKREETKKFFLDATTAGASLCRKNIVWTDLYKQNILLPKSDTEQQAIASYFTSLDRQISLQTQRLEKLKQIKSACLDKMFV